MLVEVRKILFPLNILGKSLLKECEHEGLQVPNSQIQGIKIEGDEHPKITLQFMTAHVDAPVEVPLSTHFVLSAMVITCIDHHVPLPRHATKSFKIYAQGLALVITLGIPACEDEKPTHAAHGIEAHH
ncbi:MAG: hypothetical protein COB59_11925 [Rhodospirillaceae bacterium]|nr:MAG: hypothetical protein COB59_11925 [Rhodospirillaceae bacterium]